MGYIEKGFFEYNELKELKKLPTEERYERGPVAIAECVQCIPCNPCESACPSHALVIGKTITNCPEINYDLCTGCGMCVAKCPGMAVFVVNKAYSETTATVAFPYEYYPVPSEGDIVSAVDRSGTVLCDGKVVSVKNVKAYDHTPVVMVEIPKALSDEIRSIKRGENCDGICG